VRVFLAVTFADSDIEPPATWYSLEVKTNLRTVGYVHARLTPKPRLLHIDAVFLHDDVRGQGISEQVVADLERRFQPNMMTLYPGSLLEDQTPSTRRTAREKLIKHWSRLGFALVNSNGTLMVKNLEAGLVLP